MTPPNSQPLDEAPAHRRRCRPLSRVTGRVRRRRKFWTYGAALGREEHAARLYWRLVSRVEPERASALRRDADHTFRRCSRDAVLGPHHPPRADELVRMTEATLVAPHAPPRHRRGVRPPRCCAPARVRGPSSELAACPSSVARCAGPSVRSRPRTRRGAPTHASSGGRSPSRSAPTAPSAAARMCTGRRQGGGHRRQPAVADQLGRPPSKGLGLAPARAAARTPDQGPLTPAPGTE